MQATQMSCRTLPYKYVDNVPIHLDLYAPQIGSKNVASVPAIVYFHGGGLTVGNRSSWFPEWLKSRVTSSGIAFISADYQLIPPATGHDILADIKDLFAFIRNNLNTILGDNNTPANLRIDLDAIAVAGTSAGGLCAYLAAMHADPKPKAVLCMYAMLGDVFTTHWLSPKTQVFYKNRDILDPAKFLSYTHPYPEPLQPISDSPLAYDPPSAPTPGYPANPRMLLIRLYLQLGVFVNYYLGDHEVSLHERLHDAIQENAGEDHESLLKIILPAHHHCLIPQVGVTSTWPPTFLMHGSADTVVPMQESRHMYQLLRHAGVQAHLEIAAECEHSYDLEADADSVHGPTFDRALEFLRSCLLNSS